MVGTVVEWYEFFLYATAATLVFGKYFFPATGNELDGIIQAFLTYAVGFVARPLGAASSSARSATSYGRKPSSCSSAMHHHRGLHLPASGCLPGPTPPSAAWRSRRCWSLLRLAPRA